MSLEPATLNLAVRIGPMLSTAAKSRSSASSAALTTSVFSSACSARASGDCVNSRGVALERVDEVEGILGLGAVSEGQRLEDDESRRPANRNGPGNALSGEGPAVELDHHPLIEGELKPPRHQSAEVGFEVLNEVIRIVFRRGRAADDASGVLVANVRIAREVEPVHSQLACRFRPGGAHEGDDEDCQAMLAQMARMVGELVLIGTGIDF